MSAHPIGPSEHASEDVGREVAQWLQEVGRRGAFDRQERSREPAEILLGYLAELAGRPLNSREDIDLYFAELQRQRLAAAAALKRGRLWRESLLLVCAAAAYLQFHFIDVYLAIQRLPSLIVTVPAAVTPAQKNGGG